MQQQQKPFTHTLWLQRWEGGKFREWHQAGKGRVEVHADGTITVENFQTLTVIGGWNGYTKLLPNGITPEPPEQTPKRPTTGER
jgi:hypothetical protein